MVFVCHFVTAQVFNSGFISPLVLRQAQTSNIRSAPNGKVYVAGEIEYYAETASLTHEESAEISFYPNPAKEHVFISANKPASVNIYDANGRRRLHGEVSDMDNSINLQTLQPGRYVMETIVEGKSY
jgi:hypothetical protein